MKNIRSIDDIRADIETRHFLVLAAERAMDVPGSRSWTRHQCGALRLYLRREGWNRWQMEGTCIGGFHAMLHLANACYRRAERRHIAFALGSHAPSPFLKPYPEQRGTGIGYLETEEVRMLTEWYAPVAAQRDAWRLSA